MILFLDTETTGLYPGQICQISYIMTDENGTIGKNFFFTVDFVERGAEAVHGFSVEKLRALSGGKKFCDYSNEILCDLKSADLVVTHNTAFDFMFLDKEFGRLDLAFVPKNQFCSMKNMVSVCKLSRSSGKGYKYPKLSELTAFFGITDLEILEESKKIFGSGCGYHDSRFDTTAVYLSIKRAVERKVLTGELWKDF